MHQRASLSIDGIQWYMKHNETHETKWYMSYNELSILDVVGDVLVGI